MARKSIDREQPRFKTKEIKSSAEALLFTEHMHRMGVQAAFTLENTLFAHLGGKQDPEETLRGLGIEPTQFTVDFVAGFAHIMTQKAAAIAAASRPNPATLPIPQLSSDSFLAMSHPVLFEELTQEVIDGVRQAIQTAPVVREQLEHDPTGIEYLHHYLQEEHNRPSFQSPATRQAELSGMTHALTILETFARISPYNTPPR